MRQALKCGLFALACTAALMPVDGACAATLAGNLAPVAPGTVVNLSAIGKLDWADWGLGPTNLFNHNVGGGLISDFSAIGTNAAVQYATNLHGYTWTNGQPVAAATNTTTGVLIAGLTNGFALTIPADTTPRRLTVYVGVNGAQGTFEAKLSDGSAPLYNDTSLDGGLNTSNAVYTITYAAGVTGQTLSVHFTVSALYDPAGSVTLQAATLATNSRPTVAITQPTNNQVLPNQGTFLIQATAADSDGFVTLVEFFAGGSKIGDTANTPYSLTWSNVLPGAYTLTAVATDNDGGSTTSAPVNIVVSTNFPPTVALTSPNGDDNFSLPTNITITASASDVDGLVTNVEFFADGSTLGAFRNLPYSVVWTNAAAGIHALTAKATDDKGASTISAAVTVYVTTNGGALTGIVSGVVVGQEVDLAAEGTNDWAHWGFSSQLSFNHKAGVTSRISTYNPLQADPVEYFQFADNYSGYTWSNGIPMSGATNTTTGVYVVGLGKGFELTVPVGTNARTLKVYVGTYAARGKLLAYLSDFSARIYLDASLDNFTNGPNAVYTLTFAAASSSRSLTVHYTALESHNGFGNVTLQAATLSTGNSPPDTAITSPANNASFPAPATLTIAAAASDLDGTISKVEFFQGTNKLGQVTNAPYNLTWTNVPGGSYLLTTKATDNQNEIFISNPVNIFVISNGGFLHGSFGTPSSTVDMTAEGRTDWAHWGVAYSGHGPPGFFNHKRNVPQLISDASKVGASDFQIYTDNPNGYTWADGTPITTTNTTTGIYKSNLGEGFQFTAPADTTLRRLKVYIGTYAAQGRLEATLSDFSATPYVDTSATSFNNASAVYTIVYSAASAGKKLTVKYTSNALFDDLYGNVTLQATTLASALPTLAVLNPPPPGAFGFSFPADQGLNYAVQFKGSDSPATWQTLTNLVGAGIDAIITDPPDSNRWYRVKLNLY